jgi:putative tricarboxylic transport membrane protein
MVRVKAPWPKPVAFKVLMKRMRDLRSGVFFLGLSAFVIWESLRVELGTLREPGTGFVSFCAGVALVPLSLALILRGWGTRESSNPLSRRVILALVFMFTYGLALEPLGFLLATFVFIGILFRLGEPRPWWFLLGASVLVTAAFYVTFGVLLGVYFPKGVLGI